MNRKNNRIHVFIVGLMLAAALGMSGTGFCMHGGLLCAEDQGHHQEGTCSLGHEEHHCGDEEHHCHGEDPEHENSHRHEERDYSLPGRQDGEGDPLVTVSLVVADICPQTFPDEKTFEGDIVHMHTSHLSIRTVVILS